MRRIVREAAEDDAAEGSGRLEIQVDPTSYAASVGGLQPALEIICDEAVAASAATGVQVGIVVAASRTRHPFDARTLARLAARHAGQGVGEVCAFGLNNNEWEGETAEWDGAFRIARRAGLPGVPHGGELRGPEHLAEVVEHLEPARIGHGVRAVEDPDLLARLVDRGVAFEVCPASNVHLGVYREARDVPLRRLEMPPMRHLAGSDEQGFYWSAEGVLPAQAFRTAFGRVPRVGGILPGNAFLYDVSEPAFGAAFPVPAGAGVPTAAGFGTFVVVPY